jgi:hypothetical protein
MIWSNVHSTSYLRSKFFEAAIETLIPEKCGDSERARSEWRRGPIFEDGKTNLD